MTDMKCPVCNKQMKIGTLDTDDGMGTVWMSIIDAYNSTRKALELAITGLKNCKTRDHIGAVCRIPEYVDKVLEQITAEQKE